MGGAGNALEVFFDYVCPFCKRGHEYLKEIAQSCPGLTVEWRPAEVSPGSSSSLCIAGYYFALDCGADLWAYHDAMYKAALTDRANIADAAALAKYAGGIVDAEGFEKALKGGEYKKRVSDGNDYAYKKQGVWYMPSYRMGGKKLDAKGGMGVGKGELEGFIKIP